MNISPMSTFIILLLTCGTATVSILSVYAHIIGHETQLHDLRNRVKELHFKHLIYIARQENRIPEANAKPMIGIEIPASDQIDARPEADDAQNMSIDSNSVSPTEPTVQAA